MRTGPGLMALQAEAAGLRFRPLQLMVRAACVKHRAIPGLEDRMRITGKEEIERGLEWLAAADSLLAAAAGMCGPIPLRLSEPGFSGMASIIVSQQVSKASADAIFGRLRTLVDPLDAPTFLAAGEEAWRQAGLSRPKQATLSSIAAAVEDGSLDLDAICGLDPATAIAQLTAHKGIGPWTAEIYLMFCAGHADIFPAGDLALQEAVRMLHGLAVRPGEKQCRAMAESWSPWRAVAARLLWDYYRVMRRDGMPELP